MDEAENLGDKICILHGGRMAASGSVEFLRTKFSSDCNIEVSFAEENIVEFNEFLRDKGVFFE